MLSWFMWVKRGLLSANKLTNPCEHFSAGQHIMGASAAKCFYKKI